MQKTYAYDSVRYNFRIVAVGYFLIVIAITLIVMYALDPTNFIYLFGVGAAVYGALNTFVFKSNPREVRIDDETIAFVSFGEAVYDIGKLKTFNVREFSNAQFYIRVEDNEGKRGRYWVQYYFFEDRTDLINEFYCIEKRVHPDGLKFRGREDMFNIRPCYPQNPPEQENAEPVNE